MTDERRAYEKAICEVAKVSEIGDVSDGFHTFNSLYEQRMILFAALVKAYRDKAWKSYRHEDGEYCFGGGWFIVGIDTPKGNYTYHYENKYFDLFDCEILDYGKHWDGHTEKDVTRLLSLPDVPDINDGDIISRQVAIDALDCINGAEEVLRALPSAQPATNCSEIPNSSDDTISRQAAIDVLDVLCQEHRYRIPGKRDTYSQYNEAWQDALDRAENAIGNLPSAQPERTCVNCGRTANNGGWYADGRTRCPIEEHYALAGGDGK